MMTQVCAWPLPRDPSYGGGEAQSQGRGKAHPPAPVSAAQPAPSSAASSNRHGGLWGPERTGMRLPPNPRQAGHRESHDHPSLGSGPTHTDPCPPSGSVEAWAALALAGSRGRSERWAGAVPAASGPGEGLCCSSEAKSAVSSVTSGLHSHPRLYESLLQLFSVPARPLRLRLLSVTVPWGPAQIIALMQSRPSSLPQVRSPSLRSTKSPWMWGLQTPEL